MYIPKKLPRHLQFEDIGMLAWLTAWASDRDYITEAEIIDASPAGRDRVRSSLRRLENAYMIERKRARANGRVVGVTFKVSQEL